MNTGLYVDSVQKSFDARSLLTDICVHCQRGEVIGLLGRNGCGKSTLLQIIFGSVSAEYKHVKADGVLVQKLSDNQQRIAYLPQGNLLPDAIAIGTLVRIFCGEEHYARAKAGKFIEPFLSRTADTLSGGERRLLEISMLLYSRAPYILLDEPFNGISPLNKEEVKTMIRQHPEKGFIITDHEYTTVLETSTRIVLLREGATRLIKKKEELIDFGYLPEATRAR